MSCLREDALIRVKTQTRTNHSKYQGAVGAEPVPGSPGSCSASQKEARRGLRTS